MAFWSKKAETHTNAPAHWPKITLDQFDNPGVNLIMIAGTLAPVMAPPAGSMALMETFVYDDGILEVPIVIDEAGKRTGVFSFGKNDKDAAARYSAARSLLRARENMNAVYFGPESLAPAPPVKILKPIDTPFFSRQAEPKQTANYALWWASPDDPQFSASPDRDMLDRWFAQINGYGYLMFSAFVNDLKLAGDKPKQVYGLPEPALLVQLSGPGHTDVMLHASEEDGFFLAFDEETTTVQRRHVLLRLLKDFVEPYRQQIEERKIPARTTERGLETWTRIRDAALAKEREGAQDLRLHRVKVADGRTLRDPGASSPSDRAATPDVPNDDVLGFGIDLAHNVAARRSSREVETSTAEKLAGPNFFPVIAARVGGRVYERALPYENPDVATAAAARALDEWPDADLVGVLVDAAIREHGQRTDILGVTVQHAAGTSAAAVIQRYKPSPTGAIEVTGRPSVMPRPTFLSAPSAPLRTGEPDDSLRALLADTVTRIQQIERHGKAHTDADETICSPYALVSEPDGVVTTVFAMQGPLTAADTCVRMLQDQKYASAPWVAFIFDDLMRIDGVLSRRARICVCRRGDSATAIFDHEYEGIETDGGFRWKGEPQFKRWGAPLFTS